MSNKCKSFCTNKHTIDYRPELRGLGISVNAVIFLLRARKLASLVGGEFYKFNAPALHRLCRAGDSWQEELGMTRSEFETARDQVATRIRAGMSKKEMKRVWLDDGIAPVARLVLYWVDSSGVTHWWFNEALYQAWRSQIGLDADAETRNTYRMQETSNTQKAPEPSNTFNTTNHDYDGTPDFNDSFEPEKRFFEPDDPAADHQDHVTEPPAEWIGVAGQIEGQMGKIGRDWLRGAHAEAGEQFTIYLSATDGELTRYQRNLANILQTALPGRSYVIKSAYRN